MADSRDITGKNRKFTGTGSIKVPSGTEAQRVDEAGIFRFNTDTNLAEYYDGTDWKPIDAPPTIIGFTVDGGSTVTSAEIGRSSGDATLVIQGSNFDVTSGTVVFEPESGGSNVSVQTITRTSSSSFTVTVTRTDFLEANDPYAIKLTNGSGLAATLASAIDANEPPAFDVAAGSLGSVFNGVAVGATALDASATDAEGDTITYSVTVGSLPAGLSISSSTGYITGTPSATGTETFTVQAATDKGNSTREFSITVGSLPSGGTVTTINTNEKLHAFTSSGTFTNTIASLSVEALLVAGGGGGGSGQTVCTTNHHCGGGGGAGGLIYKSAETLTTGDKTITVGTGGTGARSEIDSAGEKGTNTTALGYTTLGGGGGETRNAQAACGLNPTALDGGSGGGRSNTNGRAGNATQPGSTDGGFGNGGGTGASVAGGGGGGAGAAGLNANDGDGGAGRQYSTEFGTTYGADSAYFAGGGGGGDAGTSNDGEGGLGGGGDGVSNESSPGGPGTDGTGGGGGGGAGETPSSGDGRGGDGGDGIVLIKYDVANI